MAKPSMNLVSPKGTTILASLERLSGRAIIIPGSVRHNSTGGFEFEYEGSTEIIWDAQYTVIRNGERVFLDTDGNEFLESELRLVADSPPPAAPEHVITITMEGGVIHGVDGIPDGVILRTIDLDVEGADETRITTQANGEKAYVAEWGNDAGP